MAIKNKILLNLGEKDLILPDLIKEGLIANDRVKYFFTLLQTAKIKALRGTDFPVNLQIEKVNAKIDDIAYDDVVKNCSLVDKDTVYIPELNKILKSIDDCILSMMRPLEIAGDDERFNEYTDRYNDMQTILLKDYDETIAVKTIDLIISADKGMKDTPHLLVMDLHKELNNLLSMIALETIDGANVFNVDEEYKYIIKTFMKGLNRTAKLKFDHPGLGTTATQADNKIVIQNDIGETDAHVIVITVEDLTSNITYTDVHFNRVQFFQSILDRYSINWSTTATKEDVKFESSVYYMITGRYVAKDKDDLEDFLEYLGSRIVFMIDWNRARKKLQIFVPKKMAVELLKWAADNEIGHMAFLILGGEKILYEAISTLSTNTSLVSGKFNDILGDEKTFDAFKTVLAISCESLLKNKPRPIVYDEIKAELSKFLKSTEEIFMDYISDIAYYILDIASMLRDSLLRINSPDFIDLINKNAEIAKTLERDADNVVIKVRTLAEKDQRYIFFKELATMIDDVIDYLEEAAFYLSLLQDRFVVEEISVYLQDLSEKIVFASMEMIKIIEITMDIKQKNLREDISEFLNSIHYIRTIEQTTDKIDRIIKKLLIEKCNSFKEHYTFCEVSEKFEKSGDAFMYVAEMLYSHVMNKFTI